MAKIIWATLAYMLWDTAYTLCDVPIFGIVTTMTIDQKDSVSLNSIGRMFAIFAGIDYRNCPAVVTAAVRRLVNNSNCVISFVMCYDDSDLSVRKGESN